MNSPAAAKPFDARPLHFTRRFAAPRALVFEAWTDPDHLARWFCPAGFTVTRSSVDLRIGGGFAVSMRSPDGDDFHWRNSYREIVVPERLAYSSAVLGGGERPLFDAAATVTFADDGGGTLLTVDAVVERLHDPSAAPLAAAMEPGWADGLDNLAAYLDQCAQER
ncbi:SRPBCC domain-containing protein [Pelagibius sp.]|uniref:SRPBCC family protein n=1 Tax=Pelagibius sp. TaxID=1931238 RepID=UPI002630D2E2|nr:SRPBCC domain-containing protein [Pelagibius sp.]